MVSTRPPQTSPSVICSFFPFVFRTAVCSALQKTGSCSPGSDSPGQGQVLPGTLHRAEFFFSPSFDCKSLGYFQIPDSQDQGYPLQSHPEDAFLLPECLPKRQQPPELGGWQLPREITPLPQGPPWMGSSLFGGKCSDA